MAIRVSCVCSKRLKLTDAFAGKKVRCPACGKGIAVPATSNGVTANGHGPTQAIDLGNAFDFDSPAIDSTPAAVDDSKLPMLTDSSKSPYPIDPAKKGRAALVAILAVFLLVVTGLVVTVVMLLVGGGTDSDDPDGRGGFAHGDNNGDKLTLEEEREAKLIRDAEAKHAVEVAEQKRAQEAAQKKATEDAQEAARWKRVQDAEKLLAEQERQNKAREDAEKLRIVEAKRRAETAQKLVLDGEKALASGQLEQARRDFDRASKLDPANKNAKIGLAKATDEVNKVQKKIKHAQLVAAGQKGLKEKKYDVAVSSLKLALELDPTDAAAAVALKKAEAEQRKLDAELERFLGRGYRALKRHELVVAGKAFDDADKIAPGHPKVVAARLALATEKNRLRAEGEAKRKRKEAREKAAALVKTGRKALEEKDYQKAVSSLSEANALIPGDKVVLALLMKAGKGLEEQRLASAKERQKAEEARKSEEVRKLFSGARKALKEKNYELAEKVLAQLVKLVPNDPDILGLRQDVLAAHKGVADEKASLLAVKEANEKSDKAAAARKALLRAFDSKMKTGHAALKGKKLDEAIKAYSDALKMVEKKPGLATQEKKARAAIAEAKKAKDQADKLKLEQ